MERKPHFLDNHIEELVRSGEYVSDDSLHRFWYNAAGDCIVFLTANEGVVADRVDEYLTLYRSAVDNRVVGPQAVAYAARGSEERDSDFAGRQRRV